MNIPGEGNLFTAKPEFLTDLLTGIHRHRTALPDFQRKWIWEPQMVSDLIISVAYRYPAGSLLTMPVTTANFALRPFEGSGETLKDKPSLMILDGQQRLTSLYQALYRREGVFYKGRTFHFYLDIPMLMSDPDGNIDLGDPFFDKALFYLVEEKNGKRIRYHGLKPIYEITTTDEELEVGALPLGSFFDSDALSGWKQKYLIKTSNKDMDRFLYLDNLWDRLVQPWLTRIRNYPFPVVELRQDMPLGAICHIFEKVNSTGVTLNVFDLCNAILWAQDFRLNKEWENTVKQFSHQNMLPMQPLSGTHFLQGISLLDSIYRKRKRTGQDERLAVACRKQDLMALTKETVTKWWSVLVKGYEEASKFMADQGILAERILPYSTLIIPLTAIFADLKHRKIEAHVGAAWPKIGKWYWCSIFSQRYSSQVETNSAQDFEQVVEWIDGGDSPDVVRTFNFRSDMLQEISSIRNAIYKGILCLLAKNGAKDFSGGSKLSTSIFYGTNQDHHHLFPTDAINQLKIEDYRTNSLVNKTLIGYSVNRSISGKLPSAYIKDWREKLGAETFDEILNSHLVDPDVLSSDDWGNFLQDRREKLRKLIESVCGGVIQSFSDSQLSENNLLDSDEE